MFLLENISQVLKLFGENLTLVFVLESLRAGKGRSQGQVSSCKTSASDEAFAWSPGNGKLLSPVKGRGQSCRPGWLW